MQSEIYEQMARLEQKHFWFRARRVILCHCLQRLLPFEVGRETMILDAGCGTGGNLSLLANFGDVYGIDFERLADSFSSIEWNGRRVQGRLEQLPFQGKSFNLICLLDVLEHVEDQQAVLTEMYRSGKENGVLLVTVPAYRHLWSGHDKAHHHYRRYLKSELVAELEKAGFEVRYVSYYNSLLYPLVALKRLAGKLLSSHDKSDLKMPSGWVNRLLYEIFSLERFWIGKLNFPFGVSLVAFARKKNRV